MVSFITIQFAHTHTLITECTKPFDDKINYLTRFPKPKQKKTKEITNCENI